MTVRQLIEALDLTVVNAGDLDRPVTGGYCGDLLSWVMGRAGYGNAWITVMGNVNAIAVCVLADVSCMILSDSSPLDDAAYDRACREKVTVLSSDLDTYSLATKLFCALREEPS